MSRLAHFEHERKRQQFSSKVPRSSSVLICLNLNHICSLLFILTSLVLFYASTVNLL